MRQKPAQKIVLLLSLYFSQGIPHGFFFSSAPVMFREAGLSLAFIGGLGFFALPWALKFFTAPWVDRIYNTQLGPRRSWIIPLQMISALCLLGMAFWKPGIPFLIVGVALFVMNLSTSTQDIASDGYAVDLLEGRERGWGNGIQVGGYYLGYLFSGSLLLVAFDWVGQTAGLVLLALVLMLALGPMVAQPVLVPAHAPTARPSLRLFFGRPGIFSLLAFLMVYRAANGMVTTLSRTLMVDVGIAPDRFGFVLAVGTVGALLGALIAAGVTHHMSRKGALILFGILRLVSLSGLYLLAETETRNTALFTVAFAFDNAVFSMLTVAVFALMMDWSRPTSAATDYTLQDCFGVLSILFFGIVAAVIAEPLGYAATFLIALGLGLVGLVAAFVFNPDPHRFNQTGAA